METSAVAPTVLCNRQRAVEVMEKYNLDALCLTEGINVYYSSNFDSSLQWYWEDSDFVVYPRDPSRPATLLIPAMSLPLLINNPTWMPNVRTYILRGSGMEPPEPDIYPPIQDGTSLSQFDRKRLSLIEEARPLQMVDPESALASVIKDLGLSRARIACDNLRTGKKLTEGLAPETTVVDARDIMREIRLVKTESEIQLHREAVRRDEQALEVAIRATRPGASWFDVQLAYKVEMLRQGGDPFRLGGGRFAEPGPLAAGDIVYYDAFGSYKHYYADIGRTAYLGEAPANTKKRLRALKSGWEEGCQRLRPGVSAHDAGNLIRDTVRKSGFPDFTIVTPHSLGLEHFDHPQDKGFFQNFVLEEGTVFSVDMPFFEVGWGMLLVEDSMVMRKDGVELLSSGKTDLIEITS